MNGSLQIWEGTYTSADHEYEDDSGKRHPRGDILDAEYRVACEYYGYKESEKHA